MLIYTEIYDSMTKLQWKMLRWDHNLKALGSNSIRVTIENYYFSTICEGFPFCNRIKPMVPNYVTLASRWIQLK